MSSATADAHRPPPHPAPEQQAKESNSKHDELQQQSQTSVASAKAAQQQVQQLNDQIRKLKEEHDARLKAWENARTGYPWIDAVMTQLRTEGWIHHLARHAVACFLTRGDLWQSWEKGAQVFDHYLLDADWSINNGNWMGLSCSVCMRTYTRRRAAAANTRPLAFV